MPSYSDFIQKNLHALRDSPLFRHNPTLENPAWPESGLRVLIARLSPFRDVRSSTPHLFLFREIRREVKDAYIDFSFFPEAPDRKLLKAAGIPLLVSTQAHRPTADFDLVLISNSCIPELANLPFLLMQSGIPLWASGRGPEYPPLILGGSSSPAAQGIVAENGDGMADALFFGEGEGAVGRIAALWRDRGSAGKRESLAAIADRIEGLWPAGDLSRTVRRSVAAADPLSIKDIPYPVLPGEEAGTARLAVTKGCPCLCSFCFEGHERKPFRRIPSDALASEALALKARSGAQTLEIESFNFNTHRDIRGLFLRFHALFRTVNAMSQRADILGAAPGLLAAELAAGKRSFTLGIEGISDAMRRFLHKSLKEDEIRKVVQDLFRSKTRQLKLFFMLTGREEDDDYRELSDFLAWLRALARTGSGPRVIFSFGLLVRMPFTPLRYDRLYLEEKPWRPLIGRAKSLCETHGFEFRLAAEWKDYRIIQVLAIGGYSLSGLLEAMACGDVVYDGRFSPQAQEVLNEWLAGQEGSGDRGGENDGDRIGEGHNGAGFYGEPAREKPEDYAFPFAFLETARERASLWAGYLAAKAGKDKGYGAAAFLEAKRRASAGLHDAMAAASASASQSNNQTAELAELVSRKSRLSPVFTRVRVPREAAGMGADWLNACLLRALIALRPEQAKNILSVRETLMSAWLGGSPALPWHGWALAAVTAWDAEQARETIGGARDSAEETGFRWEPLPAEPAPATFKSARLVADLDAEFFPDSQRVISNALHAQHVPFTVKKEMDGYAFVVAEKALKKKAFFSAALRKNGAGTRLEILAGPKLDAAALFKEFPLPRAVLQAVFEVTDLAL